MTTPLPVDGDTRWYYADANNQPQGPYSSEELSRLLAARTISTATLVIKEGDAEWKPYREIFCCSPSQASLPPIPPPLSTAPQRQAASSTSQAPVMEAVGSGGSIDLFQDRIRIKRKGALAFMSHGLKGDKVIFLSQITAVQFKAAGLMRGYIQFSFPGASAAERGVLQAASDENTVMFDKARQPAFEKIRKAIENYQSGGTTGIQQPLTATVSPLSSAPSTRRTGTKKPSTVPDDIVLALILLFPLGLYLLWTEKSVSTSVKIFLSALLGSVVLVVGASFTVSPSSSGYSSSSSYESSASSASYSTSDSITEPTPKRTLPYIVAGKADTPLEQQLAFVNANKGALPSDDLTITRFRYLLEQAEAKTGETQKEIADQACKGQGLVQENGKSVSLLNFMEGVDRFLETPGLPKMKYHDAALMVAIEISK